MVSLRSDFLTAYRIYNFDKEVGHDKSKEGTEIRRSRISGEG